MPYRKWAMLLSMPPWPSHTWVRSFIVASRTNTLVFVHSCLACQLHLFVIRLGRTQLGSGHWITFDSSSNQPPSYWTHSRLKTATPEVVIHDKFPPEQAVLASQNAMRLVRSETWNCQYHIRIYKAKCLYSQWM